MLCFRDRSHAGKLLAQALSTYVNREGGIVVALPRGGVPVAAEIAHALNLPLALCMVRKLGMPGRKEVAIGAIAEGVELVFPNAPLEMIEQVKSEEWKEMERRQRVYQSDRKPPRFSEKTVILVDDGMATGYTMRAAAQSIQYHSPAEIVIAVPVAPPEVCEWFEHHVGKLFSLVIPPQMRAISLWYEDFSQVTDEEVCRLLQQFPRAN